MSSYVVHDLETANAVRASTCQIGAVVVRDNQIMERIEQLVNPDDYFDPFNMASHGITPEAVRGKPKFQDTINLLSLLLKCQVAITHGPFNRVDIARTSDERKITLSVTIWLDNQAVVRRTWPQFTKSGYALGKLVKQFNILLKHHNVLEEALANASLFAMAVAESSLPFDESSKALTLSVSTTGSRTMHRAGDPEAPSDQNCLTPKGLQHHVLAIRRRKEH